MYRREANPERGGALAGKSAYALRLRERMFVLPG